MESPFGKAVLLADRRAGGVTRDRDALARIVGATGIDFEIRPTSRAVGPGRLAREAVGDGVTFLVAVGDDATLHRVVNGVMTDEGPRNPDVVLGVLPVGSDFVRTFGLPLEAEHAAAHLAGDNVFPFDAGRIRCAGDDQTRVRWFVNVAEAGFGGAIARTGGLAPGALRRLRTLLAFWGASVRFSPVPSRVTMDEREYDGMVTNLVVANAQFVSDGRPIAPRAHPGDGTFDVLIAKGSKRDYVETLTKMPRSLHLPSPTIREYQAKRVTVDGRAPLPLAAVGLPVGATPATFEVVERALRLKI